MGLFKKQSKVSKRKLKTTTVTCTVPKASYKKEKDKVLMAVKLNLLQQLKPIIEVKEIGNDVVITATIERME